MLSLPVTNPSFDQKALGSFDVEEIVSAPEILITKLETVIAF